jgi:hypothetical protein
MTNEVVCAFEDDGMASANAAKMLAAALIVTKIWAFTQLPFGAAGLLASQPEDE